LANGTKRTQITTDADRSHEGRRTSFRSFVHGRKERTSAILLKDKDSPANGTSSTITELMSGS